MRVIVLDEHERKDATRINKHILYLLQNHVEVFHLHFNLYDSSVNSGYFSEFGEKGYRINYLMGTYSFVKRLIFNRFTLTYLHYYFACKKSINLLHFDKNSPCIIHIHDPGLLFPAMLLKKRILKKAKIVYDRHEVFEQPKNFSRLPRFNEIIPKHHIDGVISVSDLYYKNIHLFFPRAKIVTVPNWPRLNDYNRENIEQKIESFSLKSEINFIYTGSLSFHNDRDVKLLLKIGNELMDKNPRVNLFIAGYSSWGYDHELMQMMTPLQEKFNGRFHYLGSLPWLEVPQYLEKAHIGFHLIIPDCPNWGTKGSFNKVFEYINCGVIPIIKDDIDFSQELSQCSLIFNRESKDREIIDKIQFLIDSPDIFKMMMKKAIVIGERFSL